MRLWRAMAAAGVLVLALGVMPARAQEATQPPVMSHELEKRQNCMMCHSGKMQAVTAVPADHEGRGNDTCLWCHAEDGLGQVAQPAAMPHEEEGKEACLTCHRPGGMGNVKGVPENHEGIAAEQCTVCHEPAGGMGM